MPYEFLIFRMSLPRHIVVVCLMICGYYASFLFLRQWSRINCSHLVIRGQIIDFCPLVYYFHSVRCKFYCFSLIMLKNKLCFVWNLCNYDDEEVAKFLIHYFSSFRCFPHFISFFIQRFSLHFDVHPNFLVFSGLFFSARIRDCSQVLPIQDCGNACQKDCCFVGLVNL